ncbi:hypothetical protein PIB30_032472 [Stylosanthes scabra]|uniref:Protein kinase domain-containing protein n=1 Tax=Stylosanthes scabra TaxID=79078 RepID=A0ABU6TBV2_9FABA|nr:hypothetical protein [Stylosanthes scabra]
MYGFTNFGCACTLDKIALVALNDKLTNGDPHALTSWNQSLHFCQWEGVTCSRRRRRVSALQLQNQYWGGTLSPSLGNLTFLKEINLTNINLHGEIPREVGHLKRLQILDLRQNNLHGQIPIEMINCSRLDLVGSIPPSLGTLSSSLEMLSLAYNHLEGTITPALSRLSNLKLLYFGENNLFGQVPPSFYNLSNIQFLSLSGNNLSGQVPPMAFPNLQILACGMNQFNGTFPSSISNLSELIYFDLGGNDFHGPISPTIGSLQKLKLFNVAYNRFGSGRNDDLNFLSSLQNCTHLQILDIGNNYLGGVLTDLIANLSSNFFWLTMGSNQISGSIPDRIGKLINLEALGVEDNFLEGTIPYSVGKLKNLVELTLWGNKLFGNIPLVIGNLTMLSLVNLSFNKFEGFIPFTLANCTKMERFFAEHNNFSGNIPIQTFGYQQSLIELSLYSNSFTGPIPSDLGKLNRLSILHLQENKLIGEIPMELSACSALTELILERNSFHGNIPSFLGSLLSLEILDLSSNNLSSTIPHELVNLTQLSSLNLSFNHLSGEVPVGGVFNNITAISLTGNKHLCGGVPQLNLPPCPAVPLQKKHKRSIKKRVILSIAFGGVSYGELHQATNGFSSSNLIGTENFGTAYRGTLVHFEKPVAVKVLNLQTRGVSKSFVAECKALVKIKYRNLVNILTCCSSVDYKGNDFKAIVFEFMSNGSLETLLHTDTEDREFTNLSLNLIQRVNIALYVAFTLDYLHNDSSEAVAHCDIKPSNVLLDDDMVAHLGDFGLARLVPDAVSYSSSNQASSSAIKGTIEYIPPEYGGGGSVSREGDMYSYGILLLEMLTGKRATDSMFGEGLNLRSFCNMATAEGIIEIVDSRLLIPIDEQDERRRVFTRQQNMEVTIGECLVSFARIGIACSAESPSQKNGHKRCDNGVTCN